MDHSIAEPSGMTWPRVRMLGIVGTFFALVIGMQAMAMAAKEDELEPVRRPAANNTPAPNNALRGNNEAPAQEVPRNAAPTAPALRKIVIEKEAIGASPAHANTEKTTDKGEAKATKTPTEKSKEKPTSSPVVEGKIPVAEGKNNAEKIMEDRGGLDSRGESRESLSQKENLLLWLYHSMGFRYVLVFLTVSFNEVAILVMVFLGLRRSRMCPLELVAKFEEHLDKKEYQEAYELSKEDHSFLGKVLAAGMANLPESHEAAVSAMQEVGEEQNMRLEQRNGYIALIAQIGPMLGLLATVDGIVRAFAVIAGRDVTPKPSELAQGIGIAPYGETACVSKVA
jgi:biopolymer transport protein ExbB/TolQ